MTGDNSTAVKDRINKARNTWNMLKNKLFLRQQMDQSYALECCHSEQPHIWTEHSRINDQKQQRADRSIRSEMSKMDKKPKAPPREKYESRANAFKGTAQPATSSWIEMMAAKNYMAKTKDARNILNSERPASHKRHAQRKKAWGEHIRMLSENEIGQKPQGKAHAKKAENQYHKDEKEDKIGKAIANLLRGATAEQLVTTKMEKTHARHAETVSRRPGD